MALRTPAGRYASLGTATRSYPRGRLIAPQAGVNHHSHAVVQAVLQNMDHRKRRERSRIGQGKLEIGKGIRPRFDLRIDGRERRIRRRAQKIGAPRVIATFCRHRQQRGQLLGLLQIEDFH